MAIVVGYTELVLAFLCFLFLCHWIWNKNPLCPNWPVVGMLPALLRNAEYVHEFATKLLKQNGCTFVFKGPLFANMDFVITSDPMNVHHIFVKNFSNYPKGPEFKRILEPLGDGIFNADGDSWKFQRKMMHSLFKHRKFESALERSIHQKLKKGLIPVLEHASKLGTIVDMQEVFQRFTFDNICVLVLGFDPNSLSVEFPEVPYEKAYDCMEEVLLNRHIVPEWFWKLKKWLQIGDEKKMTKALETFDRFLYEHISSKREKLSKRKGQIEENEEFDLLTAIMVEEGGEMGDFGRSNIFLRDMAFNLLAAGRDTVSAALVWFLWVVVTHPSVEKKILEEIKEKLQAKEDGKLRFFSEKELKELVYFHAAICEALRLYPSGPFEHKRSVQPEILPSGHHVNANTRILISIYSMGRTEEIWGQDYSKFKPERWISEQGGIKHVPSHKFMAFLAGPRSCLGKDIGFTLIKIVASFIIWNYCVHVVEGHPVTPSLSILLYMKHGLKVGVAKRHI